ncbi:MAG: hypothetical protein ACYC3O_03270 [Burkholderiales bacterium]
MKAQSTKHPYAAIEHRVIDSDAFADLTFAARALLLQMARQLTKSNNGHLQATHKYLKRFGFSENTITRCIAELITHGFIYRSRSGGFHQGAAKYAVTWLSITNKEGIFLQGFKPFAWRDWEPDEKKTPPPNLRTCSRKNGEWTPSPTPIFEASPTPIFEDIEYMPYRGAVDGIDVALASLSEPVIGKTASRKHKSAPKHCTV